MPVVGSHRGSPGPAPRRGLAAAAVVAIAAVAACAAVEAGRRFPGVLAKGEFSPTRAPATNYGPDPTRPCPTGGAFKILSDQLAELGKTSNKPVEPDGRLCSAADTFLGWDSPDLPPEGVTTFVAWYFGLSSAPSRIVVTTIATEDQRDIASRLFDAAASFAGNAAAPRFGAATQRVKSSAGAPSGGSRTAAAGGATRVVLLLQDAAVELDPIPRQLPAGGQATLTGRLLGGLTTPKVLVSDPAGKLETPPQPPGNAFKAELRCGDRAGLMPVEIRAQREGSDVVAARFPIACGTELPKSVAVPEPPKGPVDVAAEERRLFDAMNAARAAAGVPPLAYDDSVARVARSMAEALRAESQPGTSGPAVDVVARLKEVGVVTPLVLLNPVVARTADEAQQRMLFTPVHRSNLLNPQATHGAAGVALAKSPEGVSEAFVADLLVRELPPVDVAELRTKLHAAVARKRADARAAPAEKDPRLEEVAQKYATELAAAGGNLSNAQANALVAPLYKSYQRLSVLSGAKVDPLEFAEEPGVTSAGNRLGIGVAQGNHPTLGKNTVFVVILVGEERAAAPAKKRPARRSRG